MSKTPMESHPPYEQTFRDLAVVMQQLVQNAVRVDARLDWLAQSHQESTDKLNALIDLMDRHPHEHRRPE